MKILIVEDEPKTGDYLKQGLVEAGFVVDLVRDGHDGLHQALEAKEGVKVEKENQTLASITFQNYFRMYDKLAGMTGTADTEAPEFKKIYNLSVIIMPTNQPMVRPVNSSTMTTAPLLTI